jgi:hypothetical protein
MAVAEVFVADKVPPGEMVNQFVPQLCSEVVAVKVVVLEADTSRVFDSTPVTLVNGMDVVLSVSGPVLEVVPPFTTSTTG